MTLAQLHSALGNSVILFMFVCGIWGLGAFVFRRPVGGSYLGTLVIGEILIIAQALVGVLLLARGSAPGREVHFLYGTLVVISLPAVYGYVQARSSRLDALIYGIASLLIMAFAMHAQTTAFG